MTDPAPTPVDPVLDPLEDAVLALHGERSEHAAQIAGLNAEIETERARSKILTETAYSMSYRVQTLEVMVDERDAVITSLNGAVTRLTGELDQANARIAELRDLLADWWAHEMTYDGPPWSGIEERVSEVLDLEPASEPTPDPIVLNPDGVGGDGGAGDPGAGDGEPVPAGSFPAGWNGGAWA